VPQLGAPKIARHHHRDVAETTALQDRQRWSACGTRGLSIIAAMSDEAVAVPDYEGWDVVRGRRMTLAHLSQVGTSLLNAANRFQISNEA
jgi:hypothetical protein